MKPPPAVPVTTLPFSLTFRDPLCEKRYIDDHAAKVRTHDLQAAAIYLAMVASGSLLYLVISAAGIKATTVDCCLSLIVCSWLGPATHLVLLWLLPTATYQKHRTVITLGFRMFYLLATSVNGFGVCGVGPIGSPSSPAKPVAAESPMSAFLWRSGIIGLIWYAAAFPLLFWQHALVQTGFLVAYWKTLSPLVCSTVHTVQYGPESISGFVRSARMLWSQLLAANGVPGLAAQMLETAVAADGSAGDGGSTLSGCVQGLGFLQIIAGHALPSFVIYCTEARSRQHWLTAQRQQQQSLLHRTSSNSSSSTSTSSGGSQLQQSSSWGNLAGSSGTLSIAAPAMPACMLMDGTHLKACPAGPTDMAGTAPVHSRLLSQAAVQQEASCGTSAACGARQGPSTASGSSCFSPEGTEDVPRSTSAAAGAVAGVTAAAVFAGKRLVKRTASWRWSSGSTTSCDGSGEQHQLLDLPPLDAFEVEAAAGHLPPNFPEVFVLLIGISLGWLGLCAV